MSAPNFSYDRRCVLVRNEDYENGNVPKIGDVFDNDRSYPSAYLADYKGKFTTIAIVITSGYYADACIDILDRDDKASELLGYTFHYMNLNRKEVLEDVCYYLGCSRNFANKYLKRCRYGSVNYENDLYVSFENLVDAWREKELERANKVLDKIKKEYGYKELTKSVQFSNGEAWYDYID